MGPDQAANDELEQLAADPMGAVQEFFDAADGFPEPRAVALATIAEHGGPAVRMVLARGISARGVTFYTNYEGRKGQELLARPRAALCAFVQPLGRQLRLEGVVEVVDAETSDAYFAQRPRGHQLSAWTSAQSRPLTDRTELEAAYAAASARFPDAVPRPEFWGGFCLVPDLVEFWTQREDRLHDRVELRRRDERWTARRLQP